jgi:hypothetical protein
MSKHLKNKLFFIQMKWKDDSGNQILKSTIAETAAKANYNYWLDIADICAGMTFKDFLMSIDRVTQTTLGGNP